MKPVLKFSEINVKKQNQMCAFNNKNGFMTLHGPSSGI
jgi:hypothetical protein